MINRQLSGWLNQVSSRPQIVHIFGLRQTGKTTIMNEFRKNIHPHIHYPLQNYSVLNKYRSDIESWIYEIKEEASRIKEERLHVFVDEVQKIPDLFQALQGLYDEYKGKIKFWIWGSSARPLKKRRSETLAGRFISRKLHPLSQSEIRDSKSNLAALMNIPQSISEISFHYPENYSEFMKRCLRQTMLPEPFLIEDREELDDLLEAYLAAYIENEIRRENIVSNINAFNNFITITASENSSILNFSSIAKILGVSSNTVKSWIDVLNDTFMSSYLSPYSSRLRVQLSKSPKLYFSDTGLAWFLSGNRSTPKEQTQPFGKLFESFIINEIHKQIEYQHLPWKLSYLRTKSGKEADLIISDGTKKCALEIKAKSKLQTSDYKNIKYLMSIDSSISYGVVVSLQGAPLRLSDNVYNFPAWNV